MGETSMRAIYFNPSTLQDQDKIKFWEKHSSDAQKATDKVIDAWENWLKCQEIGASVKNFSYEFSNEIWRTLKHWLVENVFNGKCAYCESPLKFDANKGVADHFRPKGGVTSKIGEKTFPVSVRFETGIDLEHPGYFWLAYDWRNILPACSHCNSKTKITQFPTRDQNLLSVWLSTEEANTLQAKPLASKNYSGLYYLSPEDLDQREIPLLLNPLNPPKELDPREHLKFDHLGQICSTALGLKTIEVLDLKREDLRQEREAAQIQARKDYGFAMMEAKTEQEVMDKLNEIREYYLLGKANYSAAVIDCLDRLVESQYRRI